MTRAALLLVLLVTGCAARKLVHAGDEYMAAGHPDAAARSYAKAVAQRPEDPGLQLKLAQARLAAGDAADAVAPARAAQGEPGSLVVLAEALAGSGAIEEALAVAREGLAEKPSPALYAVQAEAQFCAGDLNASLASWELAESRADARLAARHAFTAAVAGQGELARSLAALAEEQGDDDPLVLLDAAAARMWLGEQELAVQDAESALSLDAQLNAENGEYDRRRADAERRRKQGDRYGAWRSLLAAYALRPGDVELMRKIGTWWMADDQPGRAIPWLERALNSPPYAVTEGAAGAVSVSRASDPGLEELRVARMQLARELAAARVAVGDRLGAAKALEYAVRANPEPKADDLFELGMAWQAAGRPQEAKIAFVDAASMGHPAAINALARSLAAAGMVNEAVARCVSGLGANPGDKDLSLTLAGLYLSREEYRAALQVLGTALAAHPDDPQLKEMKARVEARMPAYR